MRDKSDSRWKYHFFKDIGDSCSAKCADIVLQYYGNRFVPDLTNYSLPLITLRVLKTLLYR